MTDLGNADGVRTMKDAPLPSNLRSDSSTARLLDAKKLMQNYAGSEYGTSNYESAYGSTSSKVNHQGRSGSVGKGKQPRRRRRKRRRGRGQACEQESIGGPELGGEWNVRPTIADIAKSSTGRSRIRSTHPNDSSLEIEGIPLPINMQSIGS